MKPNPKVKKVKLTAKQYHEMRERIYEEQCGLCIKCRHWFPQNEFSLHHWDRKLGDVWHNLDGFCLKCHPK